MKSGWAPVAVFVLLTTSPAWSQDPSASTTEEQPAPPATEAPAEPPASGPASEPVAPSQEPPSGETATAPEQAIEALRQAVNAAPNAYDIRVQLGLAEWAAGDLSAAIAQLRQATRLKPDAAEARLKLADALYQFGDVESAIEEYRVLTRLEPDLAQAHLGLGTALMVKQDWRTALAEFREALRLDAGLAQAHYNMGTIHYTTRDFPAAIQSYREALKLKPDFPDAHYHLGLVLKVANRDAEAAEELQIAATNGVPKAQYFLGSAYRSGHGVPKNLLLAIAWWVRAAEQGMSQASEALAQLRQTTLSKGPRAQKEAQAALRAFQQYLAELEQDFPDLARPDDAESVGASLLKADRAQDAIPVLIREAYALHEPSQSLLEKLYEEGIEGQVSPYDSRILNYFQTTAAAGLPRSRLMLARIYAKGLGVAPDGAKAKAMLKGFSKGDRKRTPEDAQPGRKSSPAH
ncbi:MAG TPA: tetratricopeptide repeat protein [Nitrospiraceae bacterium]|nr:tetratricopeptide repeat protein [Nitrospiraceae bacterium]